MRLELLKHCACPACQNTTLTVESPTETSSDGHVMTGKITCSQCNKTFPIENGIPLFFGTLSKTVQSNVTNFGDQWTTYHKLLKENQLEFNSYFHNSGFTPSQFQGKLILDAGCGSGKFSYLAAQYPETTIIGMDLSQATLTAFESTRHLPNVMIIQADILNPPFKQNTFDFIYSIGVLHHTENPPKSFSTLLKKLKPNAQFFFWLYSKEGNEIYLTLVDPFRKYLFCHLPHSLNNAIAWVLACITWPILLLYGLIPKDTFLTRLLPMYEYLLYFKEAGFWLWRNTILDKMIPHIAYHYSKTELQGWLKDNQAKEKSMTYRNGNSWGVLCEKP